MESWIQKALAIGFDTAASCSVDTLQPMQQVRDMCAADKCRAYGKNWTCPPACGSLEDCGREMRKFEKGILVQTVGHTRKRIDSRCYRQTEQRHLEQFRRLTREIRKGHPGALALSAGGCRVCRVCAYPEKCRFPEEAVSSMEGYGLFVTQVCRDNGLDYHHGEGTITYTACILFDEKK